jgi:hypothetical protein
MGILQNFICLVNEKVIHRQSAKPGNAERMLSMIDEAYLSDECSGTLVKIAEIMQCKFYQIKGGR